LDNLNIHLAPELAENTAWLRVYRLPAYAPDLNPVEGIWSLMKRFMAHFAAVGHGRIIKRKLKKIDRCLGRHWPENRALVTTCTLSSTWLSACYVSLSVFTIRLVRRVGTTWPADHEGRDNAQALGLGAAGLDASGRDSRVRRQPGKPGPAFLSRLGHVIGGGEHRIGPHGRAVRQGGKAAAELPAIQGCL
jgi:DDE superfamily endonuclease